MCLLHNITMIFKRPLYIFCFSAINVLLFERSSAAGKSEVNHETNSAYDEEAKYFLRIMDQSVDPCVDFYNFTCGGYMKSENSESVSLGFDLYEKMIYEIIDILESERDIPGSDVSVARNIYTNCKQIVSDWWMRRELIENIAKKIGIIHKKYSKSSEKWNDQFDWVDSVLKLRDMGLNFRFLIGFYVSPRSHTDKRNILEIRKPVLEDDMNNIVLLEEENLTIVNAKKFIDSLNGSLPLQRLIEGFLPEDTNFSMKDDIRVDEEYIRTLSNEMDNIDASLLAKTLYNKLEFEIERLVHPDVIFKRDRKLKCLKNAIYYDYSFQAAVSKTFFTEKKKKFVTEIINNIINTTKMLINSSASFDAVSKIVSIKKVSDLQLMIGYGNNIIKPPALDWNDVNFFKYANNIMTLAKHQMDAKFRQLNLVNDVREWEKDMIPSTYNAAYYPESNSLYMPALFVNTELHKLESPSYIHYGSFGYTMGHELGHVIDFSTRYNRSNEISGKLNFAWSNVEQNKECLGHTAYELTGEKKIYEEDDFADLAGYKIAYYSLLDSEKKNGADRPLPGLKYNSRQMFWITSASGSCSKDAYALTGDSSHSPDFMRVLLPLSYLPEFAKDFNCPVGSPMNRKTKCNFL